MRRQPITLFFRPSILVFILLSLSLCLALSLSLSLSLRLSLSRVPSKRRDHSGDEEKGEGGGVHLAPIPHALARSGCCNTCSLYSKDSPFSSWRSKMATVSETSWIVVRLIWSVQLLPAPGRVYIIYFLLRSLRNEPLFFGGGEEEVAMGGGGGGGGGSQGGGRVGDGRNSSRRGWRSDRGRGVGRARRGAGA